MIHRAFLLAAPLIFVGCVTSSTDNPLEDYEQLHPTTILDAPGPGAAGIALEDRDNVARGAYLVELLGCGACHTDGALIGEPKIQRSLAGSQIGIAYSNPLEYAYPGVVYPPNITPDEETGIGLWNDQQILSAIREGLGRHGNRRIMAMPWQGYAKISDEDAYAIVSYLRNIEPVRHRVPENVPPGKKAKEQFVHFGVYRSR